MGAPASSYDGFVPESRLQSSRHDVQRWSARAGDATADLFLGGPTLAAEAAAMPRGGPFTPLSWGRTADGSWVLSPTDVRLPLSDLNRPLPDVAALGLTLLIAEALRGVHDLGAWHGHLHPETIGFDGAGVLRIQPALHYPSTAEPLGGDAGSHSDCRSLGALALYLMGQDWPPQDLTAPRRIQGVDRDRAGLILTGMLRDKPRLRLAPASAIVQSLTSVFHLAQVESDAAVRELLAQAGLGDALRTRDRVEVARPGQAASALAGFSPAVVVSEAPGAADILTSPAWSAAQEAARAEATQRAREEVEAQRAEEAARAETAAIKARATAQRELAKARAEAELARRETEARLRREADERVRQEEAARAAAEEALRVEFERRIAEERARFEAERDAAEEARRQAEQARRDADEARRQVEEQARQAEEQRRLDAERRAEAEAEAAAKAAREAADRAKTAKARKAAEAARKKAEAARKEAAERAKAAADEAAKRAEERRLAEEKRQAEEAEKRAAEEARRADEKARREAEEQARLEAAEERRRAAAEAAKAAAEAARQRAIEEAARQAEEEAEERREEERQEAARAAAKAAEAQRLEEERLAAERVEAERVEAERVEAERLAAEQAAQAEAQAAEVEAAEQAEAARAEAERLAAEEAARAAGQAAAKTAAQAADRARAAASEASEATPSSEPSPEDEARAEAERRAEARRQRDRENAQAEPAVEDARDASSADLLYGRREGETILARDGASPDADWMQSGSVGVTEDTSREQELGQGKWAGIQGRSAEEIRAQLPEGAAREMDIGDSPPPYGKIALVLGTAIVVAFLGLWGWGDPPEAPPEATPRAPDDAVMPAPTVVEGSWVTITTDPAGARVTLDGEDMGKAPVEIPVPDDSDAHTVCIHKGSLESCRELTADDLLASDPYAFDGDG